MFKDNKYTRWYWKLISAAMRRDNVMSGEQHHIVPKSLGGNDSRDNIARLTTREHYIAHLLLLKMCDKPEHRRSMAFAFFRMRSSNGESRRSPSRLYELHRKNAIAAVSGSNNPFYGKGAFGASNHFYGRKHTMESRRKMSAALIGTMGGAHNPFFGKVHSKDVRRKISEQRSCPITVLFLDGSVKTFSKQGDLGSYIGKSESLARKLCSSRGNHILGKYNIQEISREDS